MAFLAIDNHENCKSITGIDIFYLTVIGRLHEAIRI